MARTDEYYDGLLLVWQRQSLAAGVCKTLPIFLKRPGIHTFEDQFNPDGTLPDSILSAGGYKKLRHSLGLVATAAVASIISRNKDFIIELWNSKLAPYSDGYFDPYYDGLLYLFSLMHLSGQYRIITPRSH